MKFSKSFGFTLIEMLAVIAVVSVLAVIVISKYSAFRESQAISNGVEEVVALINEAHNRTLSGDSSLPYGVHLQSDRAVLFQGTTYSSGGTYNKTVMIDSVAVISSISLGGGGSDIKFDQLTGDTSQYGTFIIKLSSSTAGQKTITISKTGIVSSN